MALLLLTAFAAPAQPVITNAPGYVITWDGNNGDNPTSPNVPTNIASATQGAVAYASGQLGPQIGAAFHYVTNLNDGFYGNTKSWIGGTNDPTPWFAGIQLSNAVALTGIAWGRDNTGASQDRCLGTYTLQIATNASFTTNAAAWTTVGTITYNNSVAGFSPWLRHRYQVATTAGGQIVATGVRLLVPDSGLATGTDIDELELFGSAAINLAYWRMGENDPLAANGVTNTFTSSLLGGVLTLRSNAVYTSSVASAAAAKVGSSLALQFTTGRYATNVLATTLTDNFGLELWVKPDATNAIQCIAYNGDSGPNGWGLYLYQGKYQGLFGGLAFLTGPNAVPGVWAHLALVRNNGLTTLYVNGVPSATSPLTPGVPTGRFALAAQPQTLTNEFFAGALDEVRVFTFAPGKFSIGDLLLPILPPTVATAAATAVGLVSATLNGTVNPGNLPTAAWFEWGTTTNYGNFTDTNFFAATNITFALSNNLSGLAGGTTYHYRLTASNGLGVSLGADVSFLVPLFANVPIAGPQGVYFSSVAWGDYDNDGRLDFLLTGYTGNSDASQLWRNTGSGFTNVPIAGLPGVDSGSVAWGDYDNDGRLDFLLTGYTNNGDVSQLWRNTGSGFTNVPIADLPGVYNSSVAWGDYDNDGRLDFLLTGYTGNSDVSQLWRNTGSGFTNVPIADLPGVANSSVVWADYDNDGRLDFLLTGHTGSSRISELWRNTGSGFTNVPIAGLPGVNSGSAAWGDYDNDGRLDFLLTGYNGNFVSQLWRNTGSGFTNVSIADLPGVTYPSVAWGDYDNDGRLDFLLTGAPNTSTEIFQLWHNNTPITNTPPTAPTGLALTATTGGAVLSWNSATDGQTPASGLTYNVRAGSAPGGIDLFAGHVNAANGFRRVPAIGNAMLRHTLPLPGLTNGQTVYWSVQAVDTAFAGGPFASETSFYSAIVTTTADNGAGSLRAAINNVASPKLVTFDPPLSGQTILLTSGQLTLANTMTIDALPLPGGIQISGNNSSRVFEILPGVTASLAGLTIQNGAVNGAGTAGSGGGLYNSGTLQLTNCTFTANSAIQSGGAMFILGNLTATACTFSTNTSIRGAVNVANAVANFFECTFSGNAATSIGGGALNTSSSAASVSLNSCTVSGNQATGAAVGGGVHIISGSSVTITNCILAGNSCPTVGLENFDGNLIVSGQNLTNGTPLLAPLGNYGGPTQTMPPLPSSPAIDRATNGTSFTTDQRGQPRVVGAFADLGAVEGVFNQNYPLVNVTKLGGGSVQFAFTNLSGPSYRVLASTNVAAPINTWSNLGVPTESPAGTFQFTDLQAPNYPSRFYRVTTP